MPTITVKFYGPARDVAGATSITLELEAAETVGGVATRLGETYPRLREARGVRLAVNKQYAALDRVLVEGDEVAVIPPVSGGAYAPRVALVREPIDIAGIVSDMRDTRAGAVATFAGDVREETRDDKVLTALDYEAYEDMAIEQMEAIRSGAIERFDILDAAVVHRLGRLKLGETSIAVVVSSGHRVDAFDACRWIVDQVKADVPIWKKDVWMDGSQSWVDPT